MRRFVFLLIAGLLCCLLVLGAGNAVATPPVPATSPAPANVTPQMDVEEIKPIPLPSWPGPDGHGVHGVYVPVEVRELDTQPLAVLPPADNFCPGADIDLTVEELFAGTTDVTLFDISATDPNLSSCMALPITASPQGYRTAWYEFTAPVSGRVTVEVLPNASHNNDYDTVLAVYQGQDCGALATNLLTCNDDYNGLLSRVIFSVTGGETYIIQVADRNLAASNAQLLSLQVGIETDTVWRTNAGWNSTAAQRSRHMTATVGDYIYVAGGLKAEDNFIFPLTGPYLRTDRFDRFHVPSGAWESLPEIPPACAPLANDGGGGYANTGMVHLNNRFYIPSGFVGNQAIYWGTHCVFDIGTNAWSTSLTPAPWRNGDPLAYANVIADPQSASYYIVGGITGPFFEDESVTTASADLFRYRAELDLWSSSVQGTLTPAGTARYAATGALVKTPGSNTTEVCVVGGLEPGTSPSVPAALLPGGECYNTSTRTWRPITALNVPRYLASSAIGPDGTWYVYGGINVAFDAVEEIEAYDVASNRWVVLDFPYNLDSPGRAWAQGGVVNGLLTTIGGETGPVDPAGTGGSLITAEVKQVRLPRFLFGDAPGGALLPLISVSPDVTTSEPNDTFATATYFPLNSVIHASFLDQADRFDVYRFDLDSRRNVEIYLRGIPEGDNFNILLYNRQRDVLAISLLPNQSVESIVKTLDPGTYYIMAVAEQNTIPTSPSPYQMELRAN